MLKLIPSEPPAPRKHAQSRKKSSAKKASFHTKNTLKLRGKNSIITVVSHQLKDFARDPEKASHSQMAELIYGLQKSILFVQKEKQRKLRKRK